MVKKRKGFSRGKKVMNKVAFATSAYLYKKNKIAKKIENVKKDIIQDLFTCKKEIIRAMVEALFLITGLAALIVSVIMFLSKAFPLENILLMYGVIVTLATAISIGVTSK